MVLGLGCRVDNMMAKVSAMMAKVSMDNMMGEGAGAGAGFRVQGAVSSRSVGVSTQSGKGAKTLQSSRTLHLVFTVMNMLAFFTVLNTPHI